MYFGQYDAYYWGPYHGTNLRLERSGTANILSRTNANTVVYLRLRKMASGYYWDYLTAGIGWTNVGRTSTATIPTKLGLISKTWTTGNALTTDFDDFEQNAPSYSVTDTQLGPEQTKPTGIGAIYYYHTDRLGTIRNLTDATGQAIVCYEYDAFGALKSVRGTLANEFKFTGEQWDGDAGLYSLKTTRSAT